VQELGIDGVILPDMPIEIYEESYQSLFEQYGIIPIFLITPGSAEERIRKTDTLSKGFIYVVSSASTTGMKDGFGAENTNYFNRMKAMNLNTPLLIGFGISNQSTFSQACTYASGGIIGSAFIRALEGEGSLTKRIGQFIGQIRSINE